MSGKEFKIKDINTTVVSKDEDGGKPIKYKIEYENKEGSDKITVNEKKGTEKITAKKITKVIEGKTDEDVAEKEIEVSYDDGGWFFHNGKIDKVAGKEVKEKAEVSFSGINSYRLTFWIVIGVLVVSVLGGLWYWFSSSKKEDKEEESL